MKNAKKGIIPCTKNFFLYDFLCVCGVADATMKKIICILLSFIILGASLAIFPSAYAFEQTSEMYWVEALEDEYYFPKKTDGFIKSNSFYSNIGGCYAFRDFLDEYQKTVYDAIIEKEGGLLGTITTASYSDGTTAQVSKISISFLPNYFIVETATMKETIMLTVVSALSAVIDDYPEFFWLGGFGCSYKYSNISDDSTHKKISSIELSLSIDTSSYADWDVVKSCYSQLLSAVESFKITGSTRYDKLKSIHDGICNITTYTLNVPMAHQPTGVFLNGQAVCEGYAEAMKLLCDRENIPCIIVVGTGKGGAHEWNYVQMEDGKWYGMDVTWDDQASTYYDYFLVGSESINAAFGKSKFGNGTEISGDHINTGTHFLNYSFALTYPTLSQQSYSGVIPMWNSNVTFDNTRNLMFISKNAVANEQILCTYSRFAGNAPSTNKATVSGTTTGGTVTVTSPISRTYTIVRRGDVDKTNTVNSTDYTIVRDIAMHNRAEYTDTAQFAAADMNGDGVIDAFDAIYLDLYYRGLVD